MKQMRVFAIAILALAAFTLLATDTESISALIATRAAAIALLLVFVKSIDRYGDDKQEARHTR